MFARFTFLCWILALGSDALPVRAAEDAQIASAITAQKDPRLAAPLRDSPSPLLPPSGVSVPPLPTSPLELDLSNSEEESVADETGAREVAQILVLRNEDRLHGTLGEIANGHVFWKLSPGRTVQIPLAEVDHLEYQPHLAEDALAGTAEPGTPLSAIQSPLLTLDPLESLEAEIREADAEAKRLEELGPPLLVEEYWETFTGHLSDWTRKVALGARYLAGNSKETFVDFAGDFEKRYSRFNTQINLGGQFGEANGVRGTNRWWANSNTDWNIRDQKWMYYTQMRDRYDQFENLDYRGTFSGGVGYRFYDEPMRRLITRIGPAITYEIFHAPPLRRTTPDAFGELELRWPMRPRLSLEHKTTLNPSLLDLQLLRITSNSGLAWALDDDEEWSLKLGLLWIYNGRPNTGRLRSDYTASLSVVYLKK